MPQNALAQIGGPPPAPNPEPQNNAIASGGAGGMPASSPQGMQQGGQPPQVPPPSHQQTVAALRHFSAIEQELEQLLSNPDLGKSNLKSKIIDGATTLVAKGIMTAPDAVAQLGTVPDRPFEQKMWVQKHFAQTIQAANVILDHHRQAFQGMGVPGPGESADPDDHAGMIAGLTTQYKAPPNAG